MERTTDLVTVSLGSVKTNPQPPRININAELMASSIWLIKHKYLDMNSIQMTI